MGVGMLIIPLITGGSVPLYEQIYEFIKKEIRTGKLAVATKLPSTRSLSLNLQISRSTVELAYSQLISEGYIEARPKSGYYVLSIGDLVELPLEKHKVNKELVKKKDIAMFDFSPFSVDISEFPFATWRRLSNQCMNDMNQDLFLLGESQGDRSLRVAIARYLHSSRGVLLEASQIVIGAGTDYLIQLLVQILSKHHLIAMENPSYMRAYQIFRGLGYEVAPISVNPDGIDVVELSKSEANLCYVTPSHQYPLGVVMPIKKRMELLHWACQTKDRYIIEDDHDSEFRYKGKPIPSLQGIDQNNRVIYLGTFSRAIAPAIRMGYMVLPMELAKEYQSKLSYYASTVSRIDQAIMCQFINGGFFERHLNKMRTKYKNKHDTLMKALKIFGNRVRVSGEYAGLHLVVEFKLNLSEDELIQKAKDAGILLYGLNRHFIDKKTSKYPTILLGFANVAEDMIEQGIEKLYESLVRII